MTQDNPDLPRPKPASDAQTPSLLFKRIRQLFFWTRRVQMATALSVTQSELGRVERGEIPISGELEDRLKILGIHPDTFEKGADGSFVHQAPLGLRKQPLHERQALPVGAITTDLLRCQLNATLDHALASAPDEGSQLMILLLVQQKVKGLPERFRLLDELPVNYLEIHRAAVILARMEITRYMLEEGKAFIVGDDGRKLRRRKGGWFEVQAMGKANQANLELELETTLALSGPKATRDLAHAMVYASVDFLIYGGLPEPETDDKLMYQDVQKFLLGFYRWLASPRVKPDVRIHPGWVAFHLLQTIGIVSATRKRET